MAVNWSLDQVFNQLNSGRKWTGSTISYSFPQTSAGLFSQGEAAGYRPVSPQQQDLMLLAVSTWDDLIPQGFAAGAVGSSNLEFGYTSTNIGYAHAYYPTNGSAWFNVTKPDLVNPLLGGYGFMTFIHEIGHALGLNHMGDYNGDGNWSPSSFQDSVVLSIMSYFGPRYGGPIYSPEVMQADWQGADNNAYYAQTPMVNDVMAIQAIYGRSTTTRADNTTYGFGSTVTGNAARLYDFSQNRNPILTIFDSDGIDTLNLSGWSGPSRINLEPGSFSSGNQLTNNIAIAYSTTIENAEGGTGNDVISGNEFANRLSGNGGNDELSGLAGDDTLIGGSGDDTLDGGAGNDTAIFAGVFSSFTISVTGSTVTVASSALGSDRVSNVERFQFNDTTRTLADLVPGADSTPPALQSRSPADDGAAVSVNANLVLTFSEAVKAGRGSITIFNSDNTVFRAIAADDTAQVRFSGSTATIDPAVNLVAGRSYYVTVAAGAITDLANNPYAGISGTTAWNFATGSSDTTAPQLATLTPADNAGNVAPGANLVLAFNESVTAGAGSFTIRSGSTVLRTIAVTDASQVTIQGSTVTLNPAADLPAGAAISVTVDGGAVRDLAGNAYAGFTSQTAWNFSVASAQVDDYPDTDANTPGVVTVNGAALNGNIEVGGDQDLFRVQLTAGVAYTFELSRTASGGLADPYLTLFGPTPNFVRLAEDDDGGGSGNSRIGYTATATGSYYLAVVNFDTTGTGTYTVRARTQDAQAPTLLSRTPADDATQVAVGADLVLTFSEPVVRGTGSIRLLDANGAVLRELHADDTAAVRINGSTVTIDPGNNLPAGAPLAVNIDGQAFRDAAGNAYAGITGTTAWNFSTAAPTGTDDYPLSVNTGGVVTVNGPAITARIDSPNDGDLFKVNLTAGVTYRFDLISPLSSSVDPYLALYGTLPEVELINYDDDGGPEPLDSQLFFTPTHGGTYYLAAYDYAEATGTYFLSAAQMPDDFVGTTATNGRVTVGGAASSGNINAPTDTDFFAVNLVAGLQYTFDLEAIDLEDPYLTLLDAAGLPLAIDDDTGRGLDSEITYTAPATGTYYLAANDFDLGTGRYRLSGFVRSVINGSSGNDTLNGTAGAETLSGGNGADRLRGNGGNDILQGGSGIDFALFAGRTENFSIGAVVDGWAINDDVGSQGRDLLYGVERAQFDDGPWALDIDGSAGAAVRVLGAAFGPAAAADEEFIGIALYVLDSGISEQELMQIALDVQLGPRPSNAAVVNLLYRNLTGQLPPTDVRLVFEGLISNGSVTQVGLALAAAATDINLGNIGFDEIAEIGVPYQIFTG